VAATHLQPACRDALAATGWPVRVVDVSGDDRAYWRLLAATWARGRTFTIVEHDVVVRPDTFVELAGCPAPWCAFPYRQGSEGTYGTGLGCTKFGAALLASAIDPWPWIGAQRQDAKHPPGHWCTLDAWVHRALRQAKWGGPHVHYPPLAHARPYTGPSHMCTGEPRVWRAAS